MGFKCPICLEDFGQNKEEWQKHCKEFHDGFGQDVVNIIRKTAEQNEDGE